MVLFYGQKKIFNPVTVIDALYMVVDKIKNNKELNKELEKGTYEECTFTIRCYKDGVELNGCNIAFTLYVY